MPTWDDSQYLRFVAERTRPAAELLARVALEAPDQVVDLGCGPGNSTVLLARRWPGANVTGVDSSSQMLRRARTDHPGMHFVEGDVASFQPRTPPDLLFANAVLHWLPEHAELLPRLLSTLRPGGALAIQVPCNFEEPSHRLMHDLGPQWAGRLHAVAERPAVLSAARYYDILAPLVSQLDIWQTTYQHVMPALEDIVAWMQGTGLRPYLEALPEADHAAYLDAYTRALDAAYPPRADGKRLLAFARLFFVATR